MRLLPNWFEGVFKSAESADSADRTQTHVPLFAVAAEQYDASAVINAMRESQVAFWMAEIKTMEDAKAQQLPLFYRFALKLREMTEGRRLDEELRRELSVALAEDEGDESERLARLDPAVLEREALERSEREFLRREQDAAYFASLAEDQAKEAAQRSLEVEKDTAKHVQEYHIPTVLDEPPAGSQGVVKLVLRFPDGSRVGRRFHKDDRVQHIKDFVEFSRIHVGEEIPRELFSVSYSMVVLGAPPQPLNDFSLTLEEAGLYPLSAVISINLA